MNSNAKKWVDALRSGKYLQTVGRLSGRINEDDDGDPTSGNLIGHCCLGVACEVAAEEGVIAKLAPDPYGNVQFGRKGSEEGHTLLLPEAVQMWLGLATRDGAFLLRQVSGSSLAECNDSGDDFVRIAEIIEEEPDGLFA